MKNKNILFAIVSEPRTGSNMLTSILSSNKHVVCHAEIFHPTEMYLKLPRNIRPDINERNLYPENTLQKIAQLTIKSHPGTKLVGFKIFFDHEQKIHTYIIKKRIPVILLERKNKLAQYASIKIARKTDNWICTKKNNNPNYAHQYTQTKAHFSMIEYTAYVLRSKYRFKMYKYKIKSNDVPYIHIFYEDITSGLSLDRISKFLNINKISLEDSKYHKQNTIKITDRFSNSNYVSCIQFFLNIFSKYFLQ